jgi:anthranilate synthase
LVAIDDTLPPALEVTAVDERGVVLAIEHRQLPVAAVQFHPESILTLEGGAGLKVVQNVVAGLSLNPQTKPLQFAPAG